MPIALDSITDGKDQQPDVKEEMHRIGNWFVLKLVHDPGNAPDRNAT
jgi:hypothetical protein